MFYLTDKANAEGTCFPSVNAIASDCGMSARTVKRTIAAFLKECFIMKVS